jgi:8-oxo-dGTP pyrophosphatase MutT (NUDIX family)
LTNIFQEKPFLPYSSLTATDSFDTNVYPLDFETIHKQGIPHRAVQIEIINDRGLFFVWQRTDGRLEILGGHVDWLEHQNRSEEYEEAAIREITEELNITENWKKDVESISLMVKTHLSPIVRFINQLPSSHGNNNEWVTAYKLIWQTEWSDPCKPEWKLSNEGTSPVWLSFEEIQSFSIQNPRKINAALRHFFQRRGVLIPLS